MIERMKMVYVVSSLAKKDEMLDGLRDLGLLHLAEKKSADHLISERFATLSKTASQLLDYAPDKKEQKALKDTPILSDAEFETMYQGVLEALETKASLAQEVSVAKAEIERIKVWGEFSPSDVLALKAAGYDLHFYSLAPADCALALSDENVKAIRLGSLEKTEAIAVLGTLPAEIKATEFALPEKSLSELEAQIASLNAQDEKLSETLRAAYKYKASFNDQMLKAQNAENYSSASETADGDNDFVWLSGYIPEDDMDKFKAAAKENCWAWAEEDVAEDDTKAPTKVKYNKVTSLIKPVFDIFGILPGYRETDISLWFFLFFVLFFAMIIGDAAYGTLILLGTVCLAIKTKKFNNTIFLLLVLSIATIIWGAVTGTWFGLEEAMNVPFLKALVIPNFANYPEYFGVTVSDQQNAVMKFSLSIGAIQMSIGSIIAIKNKIAAKDLSWISNLGWMVATIAMYFLALFLVIGEDLNVVPIFIAIGVAFLMVVVFGGMTPDRTFAQGLKAGLADAFTTFLNTISCFGNVMSYIRLFAVGMAGIAISQSFNGIASGFSGVLVIIGAVVVIFGHVLNIVMCFLSVAVHGVRLNVLEFSGQAGMEWSGIAYEPFKKNKKIKK